MIIEDGPTLYVVPYPAFFSACAAIFPTRTFRLKKLNISITIREYLNLLNRYHFDNKIYLY